MADESGGGRLPPNPVSRALDGEAEEDLGRTEQLQSIRLRWAVAIVAIATVLLFLGVAAATWWTRHDRYCDHYHACPSPTDDLVFWVPPILAATTIVSFLLVGVFRGIRKSDMEEIVARVARMGLHGPQ